MDRIRRRPCQLLHAAALGLLIHRDGKHYGTLVGTLRGLSNQ